MLGMIDTTGSGAGGYAQRRFDEGAAAWRKRMAPRVRLVIYPVLAACIVFEVWHPMLLQFAVGAIAGAFVALFMDLTDTPPFQIEKWRTGAVGERKTAKALAGLRKDGWQLAHDVQTLHMRSIAVSLGAPRRAATRLAIAEPAKPNAASAARVAAEGNVKRA